MLFVSGCSEYVAEQRNWEFVQSVGGMRTGKPIKEGELYYLPLVIDASGLSEITLKPTLLNSGLICSRTGHAIIGNTIYISIFTTVVGSASEGGCKSVPLIGIKEGVYEVFYGVNERKAHKFGEVQIGI